MFCVEIYARGSERYAHFTKHQTRSDITDITHHTKNHVTSKSIRSVANTNNARTHNPTHPSGKSASATTTYTPAYYPCSIPLCSLRPGLSRRRIRWEHSLQPAPWSLHLHRHYHLACQPSPPIIHCQSHLLLSSAGDQDCTHLE